MSTIVFFCIPAYGHTNPTLGVVRELEKKLGAPLFIAENPDLCGALGAALFALGEG